MLESVKCVLHLDCVLIKKVKVFSLDSCGLVGLRVIDKYRAPEFIAVYLSEDDLLDQSLSRQSIDILHHYPR